MSLLWPLFCPCIHLRCVAGDLPPSCLHVDSLRLSFYFSPPPKPAVGISLCVGLNGTFDCHRAEQEANISFPRFRQQFYGVASAPNSCRVPCFCLWVAGGREATSELLNLRSELTDIKTTSGRSMDASVGLCSCGCGSWQPTILLCSLMAKSELFFFLAPQSVVFKVAGSSHMTRAFFHLPNLCYHALFEALFWVTRKKWCDLFTA